MRYIKSLLLATLMILIIKTLSFAQPYTGTIINTQGHTYGSYLDLIINDGSNRHIQANYILDTNISSIENVAADIDEIYALAGNNPMVMNGRINENEIVVSEEIDDLNRPIILII